MLVGDGLIKTRRDFEQTFKLPSPTDAGFVGKAREFVAHKGEYLRVRRASGSASA